MKEKQSLIVQSGLLVLLLNGLLLASLYLVVGSGATILIGGGVILSLILWLGINRVGGRLLDTAGRGAEAPAVAAPPPAPVLPPPAPEQEEASALQLLSILQRKGRLIDFLQEDIRAYQDAQIGAAVRNIHEGCKEALDECLTLEPIYDVEEGREVTVEKGFDAHAVRLIGNIMGEPPFKGALRHRGWRVTRINLPERVPGLEKDRVVAAAEVEV